MTADAQFTDMPRVTAIIEAELAQDEASVRGLVDAVTDGRWEPRGFGGGIAYTNFGSGRGESQFAARAYPVAPNSPLAERIAEHIARWDPAHVLREVEAKRSILRDYAVTMRIRDEAAARISGAGDRPSSEDLSEWSRASSEAAVLEGIVRTIAAIWADDPSAREGRPA